MVLAVALPQASEVFANSANVHFHFTLIALLLLLAPVGVSAWQRGATIAGLLLCGVSSIAANFLAPLALWQAIQARQRARWIQCGALFATALAQALLLLSHPDGMHSRGTDGIGLDSLAAMVAQLGLAPLSMLLPTDSALRHLQGAHSGDLRGLAMLLGSIALAIGVLYRAWRQHDRITQQLLVAGLLVAALSTLVALTPSQHDLISTSFAGRYYYVPCVIMVIVVGRLLSSRGNWLASGLPVLLILLCAVQIRPDQRGLPWQMALAKAEQLDADQVDIWPTGWHTPNLSNSKIVAGVRLIPVESAALREYGRQRLPYLQTQATHRLDKNVLRITFTPDPLGHKLSLVYAVIPTRPRASRLMASDDGAKWIAVLHYDTAEAAQQAANAFCFAGETPDGYRALLAPIGTACREYVQQR